MYIMYCLYYNLGHILVDNNQYQVLPNYLISIGLYCSPSVRLLMLRMQSYIKLRTRLTEAPDMYVYTGKLYCSHLNSFIMYTTQHPKNGFYCHLSSGLTEMCGQDNKPRTNGFCHPSKNNYFKLHRFKLMTLFKYPINLHLSRIGLNIKFSIFA